MECQFCNLELGEHTVHGQGICGKHAEKLIRRIETLEKLVAAQQARALDVLWDCANCENREIGGGFAECPNCGAARQ